MSNWISEIVDGIYKDAIQRNLKEEPGDPVYGPTRHDMYLVHANMFVDALRELRELFEEMGSPVSFYGDEEGVYIQVGSVTLDPWDYRQL